MGWITTDNEFDTIYKESFSHPDGAVPGPWVMLQGQTPRDLVISNGTATEGNGAVVAPEAADAGYVIKRLDHFRISGYVFAAGPFGGARLAVEDPALAPATSRLGYVGINGSADTLELFWHGAYVTAPGNVAYNKVWRVGLEVTPALVRAYFVTTPVLQGPVIDNGRLVFSLSTPYTAPTAAPRSPGLFLSEPTSWVDEIWLEDGNKPPCVGRGINPVWPMPTV